MRKYINIFLILLIIGFLTFFIPFLGGKIAQSGKQAIQKFDNLENFNDYLYHGFSILLVFGLILSFSRYFYSYIDKKIIKLILWGYIILIFTFIFGLLSKLFLIGDIAAGFPPFYAKIGYFKLTHNWRPLFLIAILFLLWLIFMLFINKAKKPVLSVIILFSFLINLGVVSLTTDIATKNSEVSLLKNLQKSVSIPFLKDGEYYKDINLVKPDILKDYTKMLLIKKDFINVPRNTGIITLSSHSATHPPGPIIFLWALNKIGRNVFGTSLLVVLIGSLAVIFTYLIAKDLFNEEVAGKAASLFIFTPGIILYSAVSMDIVFMFFIAASVYFFIKALINSGLVYSFLFGLFISISLLFTFVSAFILPFLILFFFLNLKLIKKWFFVALFLIASFLFFQAILYFGFGYNPIPVFFTALANQQKFEKMFFPDRPYIYYVFGDLIDYFIFLGVPLLVLFLFYLKNIFNKIKNKFSLKTDTFFISIAAAIFLFDILGLARGETARVWLFFTPLLVISLAFFLINFFKEKKGQALAVVTFLMLSQTIIMEIYLNTYW